MSYEIANFVVPQVLYLNRLVHLLKGLVGAANFIGQDLA